MFRYQMINISYNPSDIYSLSSIYLLTYYIRFKQNADQLNYFHFKSSYKLITLYYDLYLVYISSMDRNIIIRKYMSSTGPDWTYSAHQAHLHTGGSWVHTTFLFHTYIVFFIL